MGFVKDFKEFAVKGNMVDLAVAVIIGGAFGKIVTSLVNNIIMPPVSLLLGKSDLSELKWVMKAAELDAEGNEVVAAVTMNYGTFLQSIMDFVIIALVVFMMIRALMKMKKKEEEKAAEPAKPSEEVQLLTEIRDLMNKKGE